MNSKQRNTWDVLFLYFSIIIYPLNIFVSALLRYFSLGAIARLTIFGFYLLVIILEIIILFRFPISLKRFLSLIFIYFIYILLYFFTPFEVRPKFLEIDHLFIYVFYLPYCVLIISRIVDYSILVKNNKIRLINQFLILSTFLAKYLFNDQAPYMPYSYSLLPIWLMYSLNYIEFPTFKGLPILILIPIQGILYGARGPLLFYLIGVVLFFFFRDRSENKLPKFKKISILTIMLIATIFFFVINNINIENSDSYIINKFLSGEVGVSSGRESLTALALRYLTTMGTRINGIFFDRILLPEKLYVHNFIIETLLSFGWVIGSFVIFSIFWIIASTYLKANRLNKKIIILFTCAYFLRFFISGSIYEDYTIILYFSILYSINNISKQEVRNGRFSFNIR